MKLIYRGNEQELIRRCRKKDHRAQKAIYDLYASKMLGVCTRYIKDSEKAEDVMITAFQKVFDRMNQYSGDGSLEGWVRKIMVNESLTYLRKNKSMFIEVDIVHADGEPDYSTLSSQLEANDLLQLIHELPVGYRTVFNLFAIEGYSHKEIAAQLAITESNSRSQLSRARALLQKKLADMELPLRKNIESYE